MQELDLETSERVEELSHALQRTLSERDEALRTLQQLTTAYADLLATSATSRHTSVDGSDPAPHSHSPALNSAAAAVPPLHRVSMQTQTEPHGMWGASRTASSGSSGNVAPRDVAVQATVSGDGSISDSVAMAKTLLEMQRCSEEAAAAKHDAVARMHEVQEDAAVARRARRDAELALEAARREVAELQNVLEDREKVLEDSVREKQLAESAKEKAEERLARLQVLVSSCCSRVHCLESKPRSIS
jgi:hypothetical protein